LNFAPLPEHLTTESFTRQISNLAVNLKVL